MRSRQPQKYLVGRVTPLVRQLNGHTSLQELLIDRLLDNHNVPEGAVDSPYTGRINRGLVANVVSITVRSSHILSLRQLVRQPMSFYRIVHHGTRSGPSSAWTAAPGHT